MSPLIVFEGLDGVGKTTLSKNLQRSLRAAGISAVVEASPGARNGSLGKLVYELHHQPIAHGVELKSPLALQALHVSAHIDALECTILPLLQSGQWVILDRFWWSTEAYGLASSCNSRALNLLIDAEREVWRSVKNPTVFLIRRGAPEDEAGRTRAAHYERIAKRESAEYDVSTIRNDGTINEALLEIISYLQVQGVITKGQAVQSAAVLVDPVEVLPEATQLSLDFSEASTPQRKRRLSAARPRLAPAKPSDVYDTFWQFAYERQEIFIKRATGTPPPWTSDPIISEYKFTNPYRVCDRVSQFLVSEVIQEECSDVDLLFRILLFKVFNSIETWRLLVRELGEITWKRYRFKKYDAILTRALQRGDSIFSGAYIMPSGGVDPAHPFKHQRFLRLLESMLVGSLLDDLRSSRSMREAFEILRNYPMLGDFLAYQYVTDINYSRILNFDEDSFVVAGPGARSGLRKCFSDFGGLNEEELIKVVASVQREEFDARGLDFKFLGTRSLKLIDIQNLFCETDKYSRVAHPEVVGVGGRTRIKQRFRPNPVPIGLVFPAKWGIQSWADQLQTTGGTSVLE